LHCARDRQEKLLTADQRKNVAFHMPKIADWQQA